MPSPQPSLVIPKKLRDWCNIWAHRFGLEKQWEVAYQVRRVKSHSALTSWSRGYKTATITFDDDLIHSKIVSDHSKQQTVIHEHLHLIFAQLDDAIEKHVGSRSPLYKEFTDRQEELIDTLSVLFQRAYSRKRRVI